MLLRSFTSNLEEVANLVCSVQLSLLPSVEQDISSSSWTMGWRPSVANWGSGVSHVAQRIQLFVHYCGHYGCRIMCRGMIGIISLCQSAATSKILKRCWSRRVNSVSSAISSSQTCNLLTLTYSFFVAVNAVWSVYHIFTAHSRLWLGRPTSTILKMIL